MDTVVRCFMTDWSLLRGWHLFETSSTFLPGPRLKLSQLSIPQSLMYFCYSQLETNTVEAKFQIANLCALGLFLDVEKDSLDRFCGTSVAIVPVNELLGQKNDNVI